MWHLLQSSMGVARGMHKAKANNYNDAHSSGNLSCNDSAASVASVFCCSLVLLLVVYSLWCVSHCLTVMFVLTSALIREASRTLSAVLSVCSVRANSLHEMFQAVCRLAGLLYMLQPHVYRSFAVLLRSFTVGSPFRAAVASHCFPTSKQF